MSLRRLARLDYLSRRSRHAPRLALKPGNHCARLLVHVRPHAKTQPEKEERKKEGRGAVRTRSSRSNAVKGVGATLQGGSVQCPSPPFSSAGADTTLITRIRLYIHAVWFAPRQDRQAMCLVVSRILYKRFANLLCMAMRTWWAAR